LWLEISALNPQGTPLTRTDCKSTDFLLFPEDFLKNSDDAYSPVLQKNGIKESQNSIFRNSNAGINSKRYASKNSFNYLIIHFFASRSKSFIEIGSNSSIPPPFRRL
jgi:hypothetical protein